MRPALRAEIDSSLRAIPPGDETEESTRADVLARLARGDDLIRGGQPDRPDPHLVSYTLVTDGRSVLLCHHKKAGLWLPTGGHVDPGEAPLATAQREIVEELGAALPLISDFPVFVTCQKTTGPNPHHDLSLWYLFEGDPEHSYDWDAGEFLDVAWFAPEDIPLGQCEPQLPRAIDKLRRLRHLSS